MNNKNTLCGQNADYLMLKQVVCMITTMFSISENAKIIQVYNLSFQSNSILYLFMCCLNSPKANYRVSMSKRKTKHTQTNDKTRQFISFR
jgi:hypothetical protein